MNPDDPRHGTNAGYYKGCRQDCCRRAAARYNKEYLRRRQNGPVTVPTVGMTRRVQALHALGWTATDIASDVGVAVDRVVGWMQHPRGYALIDTANRVASLYERLSMRLPAETIGTKRARLRAQRNGWPVPLAWNDEDIDDPNAQPVGLRCDSGRVRIHLDDILELVRYGCTYEQIAARLGCSRDGVYDKLRRAGKVDALRILRIRGEETSAGRAVKGVKGRARRVA